MLESWCSISP